MIFCSTLQQITCNVANSFQACDNVCIQDKLVREPVRGKENNGKNASMNDVKLQSDWMARKSVPNSISKYQWHEFYSNLFAKELPTPTNDTHKNQPNQCQSQKTTRLENINPNSSSWLDDPFDENELRTTIKKLSNNKTLGIDGIPNEVLKAISIRHTPQLLEIMNRILETGEIPEDWCKTLIQPIFKKGDREEPSNYRPISLLSTLLKLLTSMIASRLGRWGEQFGKISEVQAGFKKGTGTMEQVFTLYTIIQSKLKDVGGKLYTAFVDLKSAFDSPPHDKLWRKMASIGMGEKTLRLVKNLYHQANGVVRTGEGLTPSFPIDKGVLQGDSASPLIFNCFIDSVVKDLNNSGIQAIHIGSALLHILMFADDVVLVANTAYQLQQKIDILANSFREMGLTVNISKTKVLLFAKRKPSYSLKFHWDDAPLETVDEYTYLGVIFHRNGHFSKATSHFIYKSATASAQVIGICQRGKIPLIDTHKKLVQSLVKSVFLYCSPIWALNLDENTIDQPQCQFWKRVLHLPKSTPGYVVRLETGSEHTSIQIIKSTLRFICKILAKDDNSVLSQCLKWQLRWETRISSARQNWAKQLQKWLRLTDDHSILSLPYSELKTALPLRLNTIISKLKIHFINKDVKRMTESKWTPDYAKLKTHATTEPYLFNSNATEAKIMAQSRINLHRIILKSKVAPLQDKAPCPWCSLTTGNIDHYIFECPVLETPRAALPQTSQQTFIALLNDNKTPEAIYKSIFIFWSAAFNLLPD
ncbi:Retrovirus-related Pol polyprotein from type-1 retrotransposable element R2 [Folsomia candida]|uniref:Retrovirus-related Pol polyprotein from type-1 retrotransposable element R2 n=1 Tax=Folsomia candida TaxID=158441 RepID=A0A226F3F3_FOLCA|nr:Retrovirus-related Pol polyprotein from type-1 retrotransposable element R2 [Folsomia candida]